MDKSKPNVGSATHSIHALTCLCCSLKAELYDKQPWYSKSPVFANIFCCSMTLLRPCKLFKMYSRSEYLSITLKKYLIKNGSTP